MRYVFQSLVLAVVCCALSWPVHAQNLVSNPDLVSTANGTVQGWEHGTSLVQGVDQSEFAVGRPAEDTGRMLGVKGGRDRAGFWSCTLEDVQPFTDYRLRFTVYRQQSVNGMYPYFEIFGQRQTLDQAWFSRCMHQVDCVLNSGTFAGSVPLVLANSHPLWVWFGDVRVEPLDKRQSRKAGYGREGRGQSKRVQRNVFPLGLYGTSPQDFSLIAASPFNLVRTAPKPQVVQRARAMGLDVFCRMPHAPKKLEQTAASMQEAGVNFGPNDLVYIDDEPELRSVCPDKLNRARERIKEMWPEVPASMAILRPRFVASYRKAADIFMMDQYPVPSQPMTWLSDSIDLAQSLLCSPVDYLRGNKWSVQDPAGGEDYGTDFSCSDQWRHCVSDQDKEVWAIIQAFGGGRMQKHGWPRMPSYEEMRCLSYLALVHNAQGLFYYTYSFLKEHPQAWEGVQRIGRQIRELEPELLWDEPFRPLPVQVHSRFKTDAKGRPAVHAGLKWQQGEGLLIAVNVIDRPVQVQVNGLPGHLQSLDAPFTTTRYVVKEGNVRLDLAPYQVLVLKNQGDVNEPDPEVRETRAMSPMQKILARAPDQEAGPSW
jgi:hypothetical protein